MQNCRELVGSASDHIEGNTSLWQKLNYRLHLMMCKHCSVYIENLNTTLDMVGKSGEAKNPSEADIDHIVNKMKSE